MAKRQDNPDEPQRHSWFPILLLLIGLAVPAGGLWFLTAANRAPSVAVATSTSVPQLSATATPIPATASTIPTVNIDPTLVGPTLVAPTLVGPTSTPTVAPAAAPPGEATEIAIVHSNDTWGYILPCG
jgi:hypothetical protein